MLLYSAITVSPIGVKPSLVKIMTVYWQRREFMILMTCYGVEIVSGAIAGWSKVTEVYAKLQVSKLLF
jgi:hypothetical protein